MTLEQFAELLERTTGLDTDVIGMQPIARAVSVRQTACRLGSLHAYWEHVQDSHRELQELIEEVIVPETWFFRERHALSAMVQLVQRWLPRRHGVIRALSLPCASGEEPYSMAMALLDAGVPPERFHIHAIDISIHGLNKARRGLYGRNAFRGKDLGFRDRYFSKTHEGYRLADKVTGIVTFRHGNLFDARTMPHAASFDIIFLRNLLIYFDAQRQSQAIAAALRLLHHDGCLFVGAAETGLLRAHGLVPIDIPMSFGYQRTMDEASGKRPLHAIKKPRVASSMPARGQAPRTAPAAKPARVPPVPLAPLVPAGDAIAPAPGPAEEGRFVILEQAAALADQGQLERAAALCEQHLQAYGPSAQALHLLGLVQDARGNTQQAADFYRKVLYLDPHHEEALAHLAALLDKQGNAAEAARLRQRSERVSMRNEK